MGKSIQNGFTFSQHFEAVGRINLLYKKATYLRTEKDTHGRKDVYFKKYEAKFKLKSGRKCKAYITIMNTKQAGDIIYSLELLK